MNTLSTQSGHWTNEELVAFLYGVGPIGKHLDGCPDCQARLGAMRSRRREIESLCGVGDAVDAKVLDAQRRAIYCRLDQPVRWWQSVAVRRFAVGLTTACVLSGSIFVYEQKREIRLAQERASDAKLVQEVATMANDDGASSMAPLEGLFE